MLFDISPATWQMWCLTTLTLVMVMVVESDVRQHRISNVAVLLLLGAGVALNSLGPANGREGLFSHFPGALGLGSALSGVLVGLLLFLPFYVLRAMGAGDVKLMAALGAFAGPVEVISLALSVLVAGGLLAILRMLWARKSRLVLSNVMLMLNSGIRRFDPAIQSADRMPYALAFAAGLAFYSYWRLAGGAPLLNF